MPMRVTIDAIPLLVRSAGIKNYLYYWTRHLRQEAHAGVEIRLFPYLGHPAGIDHEGSVTNPVSTMARLGLLFLMNRTTAAFSDWVIPATDVFHTCKVLHPPRRARLTATVHDLTCWIMPETHSPANVAADRRFADLILRRADGLIAASEATRDDAVRILGLDPAKFRVIYHGIADPYFQVTAAHAEAARGRFGLKRPYLLAVGTIEPRKNVDLLLDAYGGLPASIREEFELVFAGPPGWAQSATKARLQQPPPGVRYIGYVDEEAMPGIFAGATALVYPSLYEGFGFPVAQAMAAGTPVITSNVSALPEVAGGAAILIDPHSKAELRDAMRDLLTAPSERARLIELGRVNAQRFRWAESARQSLRFFQDLAG
jgi:glycosyltransferase involved in cell wall biosynthesis